MIFETLVITLLCLIGVRVFSTPRTRAMQDADGPWAAHLWFIGLIVAWVFLATEIVGKIVAT